MYALLLNLPYACRRAAHVLRHGAMCDRLFQTQLTLNKHTVKLGSSNGASNGEGRGCQGGHRSPRSQSPSGTMSQFSMQPGGTSMQTMAPGVQSMPPMTGGFHPAAPRTSAGAVQSATGTMFMGAPPYQLQSSQMPSMQPPSPVGSVSQVFSQSQPRAQPGFGTMGSQAFLPAQSTAAMTPVPTPPHSGHLSGGPGGMPVSLPNEFASQGVLQSAPPQAHGHGADPARQGSAGGLKLFNGPGSFGPAPEDGSGLSLKNVRSVVLLSILTFVCVCALPVLCAYQLLEDKHYRFWMGTDYPYKLLVRSSARSRVRR